MPCSPDAWSAWPRPARSFWRAARCAGGVRSRWCPTHASAWCAPRTSSTTCRPPSRGCARTARSPGSSAPRRPATSSSTASRAYTGPAPCAAVGAVVFDSATRWPRRRGGKGPALSAGDHTGRRAPDHRGGAHVLRVDDRLQLGNDILVQAHCSAPEMSASTTSMCNLVMPPLRGRAGCAAPRCRTREHQLGELMVGDPGQRLVRRDQVLVDEVGGDAERRRSALADPAVARTGRGWTCVGLRFDVARHRPGASN